MTKYLFSITLTINLLLPLGIGFAHAFHNHDDKVCLATTEKHIHQEKIDCSFFHYFSQTNYTPYPVSFELTTPTFQPKANYKLSTLHFTKNIGIISSRGPPQINAF